MHQCIVHDKVQKSKVNKKLALSCRSFKYLQSDVPCSRLAISLRFCLPSICQSLQKRKNRRVCSPEKAGDQVERCTFSGVDGVRVNCTSTHLNKPEQSIRVGTFVPPPFLKYHKQFLWCVCGDCCFVKLSNAKFSLGFRTL